MKFESLTKRSAVAYTPTFSQEAAVTVVIMAQIMKPPNAIKLPTELFQMSTSLEEQLPSKILPIETR